MDFFLVCNASTQPTLQLRQQTVCTNSEDEPRPPSLRMPSPSCCALARAHHRKGSLHRLCRVRVLLRIIYILRLSGLVYPKTKERKQKRWKKERKNWEHKKKTNTQTIILHKFTSLD